MIQLLRRLEFVALPRFYHLTLDADLDLAALRQTRKKTFD
jgi:hypothetical protein